MTSLYVDRKGMRLESESNVLKLYQNDRLMQKIPLQLLDRVIIQSETLLSSRLLTHLANADARYCAVDSCES